MDTEHTQFLESLHRVLNVQHLQEQQGLNDYNIFSALLEPDSEINIHTRFIYSLISPQGAHYQGTSFLEEILRHLNIKHFNAAKAKVDTSLPNIDIYLSDGTKHIILLTNHVVEKDRIEKIINSLIEIKGLNSNKIVDNVSCYYLTPFGDNPSLDNLGVFSIDENTLYTTSAKKTDFENFYDQQISNSTLSPTRLNIINKRKDRKNTLVKKAISLEFHAISYKQSLLPWVSACIENILANSSINQMHLKHLIDALYQYKTTLEIITQQREPNVMTLYSHLTRKNKDTQILKNRKDLQLALEICSEEIKLKGAALYEFFNSLKQRYNTITTVHEYQFDANKCQGFYKNGKSKKKYFGILISHTIDDNGPFFISVQATVNNLYVGLFNGRDSNKNFKQLGEQLPADYRQFNQYGGWYAKKVCSLMSLTNLASLIDEAETNDKEILDQEISYLIALLERTSKNK